VNLSAALTAQLGFTTGDIEHMHHAALRVLHEIGLRIDNAHALQVLSENGVRIVDNRALFDPPFVEKQLAVIRQIRDSDQGTALNAHPRTSAIDLLTITVGDMCQYYHNPFTDKINLLSND